MTPDFIKKIITSLRALIRTLKLRKQQIEDVAADRAQQSSSESDSPLNNWLINESVTCKFRHFCESAGFEVFLSVTKKIAIVWEYLQKYCRTA
jgi:hypothetical protein